MAMAKDDAKEHDKFHACLHWAKEKLSNFRTDERRKVKIIEGQPSKVVYVDI